MKWPSNYSIFIVTMMMVSLTACGGGMSKGNRIGPRTDAAYALLLTQQLRSPTSSAQCLAMHMMASANRHRGSTGQYRRRSALYGGLATAVGALTTTFVAAFRADDTRTAIGLTGGLATGTLGVLQVVHASGSDPGAFVAVTDQIVAEFVAAQFGNSQSTADSLIFTQAADIKSKYPEFADFPIITSVGDPACVNVMPIIRTPAPAATARPARAEPAPAEPVPPVQPSEIR